MSDESEQVGTDQARAITDFAKDFLADDAVAIIVRQQLLLDDLENPVIFPPTYLPARGNAQEQNTEDQEKKKKEKKEQQKAIYNLDPLGGDKNVCEIDSPQSDGNRTEPLFKSPVLRKLVPQIDIAVGTATKSILDAGHRAADAVVRFSSLAAEFHAAFQRTRLSPPDHSLLATLAPTSLLYGAYDSRSTQSRLQRIIKASVRAENVKYMRKSATFIPAVDYVAVGAIKEELDDGESDSNPLSSEGMKHALASETLGGVRLTDPKLLVRTIKINLTALRQLNAVVDPPKLENSATEEQKREIDAVTRTVPQQSKERTEALRKYILGLALTVAKATPDLNLREGCNLRLSGEDKWILVRHRKEDEQVSVGDVLTFAEDSAKAFFASMGIDFDTKDHLDVKFEKDVAEEFLGLKDAKGKLSGAERDKVRALGPITKSTLAAYWAERRKREKADDPFEALRKLVEGLDFKGREGQKKFKSNSSQKNLGPKLTEIEADASADDRLKGIASAIKELFTDEVGANERKQRMLEFFPKAPAEPAEELPAVVMQQPTEETPQ